jgi:hypothetical protein
VSRLEHGEMRLWVCSREAFVLAAAVSAPVLVCVVVRLCMRPGSGEVGV